MTNNSNIPDTPDTPYTPDSTHPLSPNLKELEPGLLYAVLSYRGDLATWNWAFFVPDPSENPIGTSGTIFHVVDHEGVGVWEFEGESKDVVSSNLVVAVVVLGDVNFLGSYEDIVGQDCLMQMLTTVAIPSKATPDFSSRSWFLDAVCVLHDCGVVHCDDVWLLEREIRKCAFLAMDRYLDDQGWTAYRAENCD